MKILITGGVGFIGTNTAIYSARLGHQVTVIDNFSRPLVEKNAAYLAQKFPQIKIIKSAVQNINKYQQYLLKAEVVIHLAGQTAVTKSILNPQHDYQQNVAASFKLLDFLRLNNPQAIFIYASTNKVYGSLDQYQFILNKKKHCYQIQKKIKEIDENEKLNFVSPYACSKGAIDQYTLDYARSYQLKTVVFRQSCIYGPFQMGVEDQGWVAHLIKQIQQKKVINIYGDGYQVRDLLFVDDLIKAYYSAIKRIKQSQGQVFNLGGGLINSNSVFNILNLLAAELQTKIRIKYYPIRLGDQKYFVSNNQKAFQMLNWSPQVNYQTGLKKLINWFKTSH